LITPLPSSKSSSEPKASPGITTAPSIFDYQRRHTVVIVYSKRLLMLSLSTCVTATASSASTNEVYCRRRSTSALLRCLLEEVREAHAPYPANSTDSPQMCAQRHSARVV
jgi:hypothetical protein